MSDDMRMGSIVFGPYGPNGELAGLLEKAKAHVMTPKERYKQKVSFIYGQLMDCNPSITIEEIKRHLAEMGVVDPESEQVVARGKQGKS